jgi:hypothetical protein
MTNAENDPIFDQVAHVAAAMCVAANATGPKEVKLDCIQSAVSLVFAMGSRYILAHAIPSAREAESKKELVELFRTNEAGLAAHCDKTLKELMNRISVLHSTPERPTSDKPAKPIKPFTYKG